MAPGFDLRHLRYFVAVAEEGSFRRAAERLHLSQPPLSRQVRELEEAVGLALLERSTGGVTLTRAGRTFLERAKRLLAQAGRLAEGLAVAPRERLRIGISPGVPPERRRQLERAWGAALPRGAHDIGVRPSRELLPALREGRLDFAVVAYGAPADVEGLTVRELYLDPLVALLPAKHPAARKRRVSLLDPADLPFFWMPRAYNPTYHDHCARVFRALGFQPRYRRVDPGSLMTLEHIALGEGWTVTNAPMTSTRLAGVAYRQLAEGARIAVHVAAAWRDPADPRATGLARVAAKILPGPKGR